MKNQFTLTTCATLLAVLLCVSTGAGSGWYSFVNTQVPRATSLRFEGGADAAGLTAAETREVSVSRLMVGHRMTISMDSTSGRPTMVDVGLSEIMRHYDQETLAAFFPGMATWPGWAILAITPLLDEPIDEHGNRMLHIAARSGNQFAIWSLMRLGADASVLNVGQQTPLMALRCADQSTRDAIIACLKRQDASIAAIPTLSRVVS